MERNSSRIAGLLRGNFRLSRWDERRAKFILRWTFGGSAGVAPAGLGVAPEPSLDKLVCLTGFRRDAENGNRDGRAPRRKATP